MNEELQEKIRMLKEQAEKVKNPQTWQFLPVEDDQIDRVNFINTAKPPTILALIAELEYWQDYADVLEKEKSAYYMEFDKLAKKLGVFEKTDPGKPETFSVFAEIFDQLKNEANWLAAKANDAGNCLDRKCPQFEFPSNEKLYHEKCIACWREAARKAVEA